MAQVTHNSNVLTPPAWAGDYFNREHLIPGAQLEPAQTSKTAVLPRAKRPFSSTSF